MYILWKLNWDSKRQGKTKKKFEQNIVSFSFHFFSFRWWKTRRTEKQLSKIFTSFYSKRKLWPFHCYCLGTQVSSKSCYRFYLKTYLEPRNFEFSSFNLEFGNFSFFFFFGFFFFFFILKLFSLFSLYNCSKYIFKLCNSPSGCFFSKHVKCWLYLFLFIQPRLYSQN